MTSLEAKAILMLYRPEVDDSRDPLFEEALRLVENDAELSQWLEAEQDRDNLIAANLRKTVEAPISLRNALLTKSAALRQPSKPLWNIGYFFRYAIPLVLIVAAIVIYLAKPNVPAIADFRTEMVAFIRVPPGLDLKTHDLTEASNWLQSSEGFSPIAFPLKTRQEQLVGCRTLIFHKQKVALICFLRKDHQLIHLFVVNRTALPHATRLDPPQFVQEGEWMTATWTDEGMVYMLTTKGDRAQLAPYL